LTKQKKSDWESDEPNLQERQYIQGKEKFLKKRLNFSGKLNRMILIGNRCKKTI